MIKSQQADARLTEELAVLRLRHLSRLKLTPEKSAYQGGPCVFPPCYHTQTGSGSCVFSLPPSLTVTERHRDLKPNRVPLGDCGFFFFFFLAH